MRYKVDLPNYGVFDEKRVFDAGPDAGADQLPRRAHRRADLRGHLEGRGRASACRRRGAEILISPNGSPFDWPKPDLRMNVAVARVDGDRAAAASTSTRSAARTSWCSTAPRSCSTPTRSLAVQLPAWEEAVGARPRWRRTAGGWRCEPGERAVLEEGDAAAYHACVLGLRDYVDKNGFPGVVLGLSGGID